MKLSVFDTTGKETGNVDVPAGLLDLKPRPDVLHAVVIWQQQKKRVYTAHTKTRAEVAGGGRKPWKQKGTGRARAGSRTSPLWRGGGAIHGPRTKTVAPKLPKKVRRLGLQMALSDRAQEAQLKVVKSLELEAPSAKAAQGIVAALGGKRTLVVLGTPREQKGRPTSSERSYRNLVGVRVLFPAGLNVLDILHADTVLVDESAVPQVLERITKTTGAAA